MDRLEKLRPRRHTKSLRLRSLCQTQEFPCQGLLSWCGLDVGREVGRLGGWEGMEEKGEEKREKREKRMGEKGGVGMMV